MSHGSTAVHLVDGVRTPQGRYGGAPAAVRPDDLAALVVGEALRRSGAPADAVEEGVLGAADQAGEDDRDVARLPVTLLGRLEREGGRRGLATLCVGVGQGVAMLVGKA
jgi:acetyl-CoA acetyltransferase